MTGESPTPETIFGEAIELSSRQDRSLFLDRACQGNADLRRDVERLVEDHFRAGSFLESPAMEEQRTAHLEPIAEGPGKVIGPYKLLQQIGEGGMGVVFMAEQTEPIQRTVALKIIKPGMDTRQVIARFEAERQAVAMMDHPNIAKVLDAGTTDSGRPYFVMELVKGVPITKYCDEKHLPLRARLELFTQVCQAVQHAHQKGIIHRDIKPNNVLVAEYDNQAVPKVIDFGVAKATAHRLTERTMFTEFGQVLGTMEYMSPEQAKLNQLDVDTRSDVYSLGVLLYELLAGSTPFEGERLHEAAFDEMLRIIREEEPPKPSTRLSSLSLRERAGVRVPTELSSIAANRHTEPARLSKEVRGELDWIVMKALEKDRDRRYETASGFAADVERHLHDEPVEAGPPSRAYRFRKFASRNKPALLTTTLVAAALILGTTASTWQAIRASRAEAESRRREAETQAVLDFVENKIFAAARPEGLEGGLGRDVMLRQAVDAALPYVETSFTDQPLIEARLRMTLGNSFGQLGEVDIAADQYQKARALYTQHLGPDALYTLRCMRGLALSYTYLGQHADALKLCEETLALMNAKLGPDDPDTLESMSTLAGIYTNSGRHTDALKLQKAALALGKTKLGPNHPDTLRSMLGVAGSYTNLGRLREALELNEETLALMKSTLGPDHPNTLHIMHNLAETYSRLGRKSEAIKLMEQTLALRKEKLGPHHPDTLSSMSSLAKIYRSAAGRSADGRDLMEEAITLCADKLGPDHPETLYCMNEAAWYLANDRGLKAHHRHRAVELAKKAVEFAPKKGGYWNTLGVAQYRAGDWQAAVDALERSIQLSNGGDSTDFFFLAMAEWQLGHKDEARNWYERAAQWMEKNSTNGGELRDEAGELLDITEPESPTRPLPVESEIPNTDNPKPASPLTTDN